MDWHARVSLTNYIVTAILMWVGSVTAYRAYTQQLKGDAKRLVLGLFLITIGSAVHQTYWGVRKGLSVAGESELSEYLVEHAWTLSIPYWSIHCGAAIIAYALFRNNCFVYNTLGKVGQTRWSTGLTMWLSLVAILWLSVLILIQGE